MSSIRAKIMRSISGAYIRRLHIDNLDMQKIRRRWSRIGHVMMMATGVRIESAYPKRAFIASMKPSGVSYSVSVLTP